jgi:hypothetical protein
MELETEDLVNNKMEMRTAIHSVNILFNFSLLKQWHYVTHMLAALPQLVSP